MPTDGCSQLYVGDIEIKFENFVAIQSPHKHEDEYLVIDNEEPRSISPSPLELHEIGPSKKEEDEEVHLLEGYLNMNENNIQ